jgi:hypothetical protein
VLDLPFAISHQTMQSIARSWVLPLSSVWLLAGTLPGGHALSSDRIEGCVPLPPPLPGVPPICGSPGCASGWPPGAVPGPEALVAPTVKGQMPLAVSAVAVAAPTGRCPGPGRCRSCCPRRWWHPR